MAWFLPEGLWAPGLPGLAGRPYLPAGGDPSYSKSMDARKSVKALAEEYGSPHEWLYRIALGEPLKHRYYREVEKDGEVIPELVEEDYYPPMQMRFEAAKAAAPFFAPKLQTQKLEHSGKDGTPLSVEVEFVNTGGVTIVGSKDEAT